MQAIYITQEQWTAFTNLCSRIGYVLPMYTTVSHPRTGEMGYLVDKSAWDTVFISIGVNPYHD